MSPLFSSLTMYNYRQYMHERILFISKAGHWMLIKGKIDPPPPLQKREQIFLSLQYIYKEHKQLIRPITLELCVCVYL